MAEIEEVGVEAVVKGFGAFMTKMAVMNKAIQASGAAGLAAKAGIIGLSLAFGAVALAVTGVLVGIGLLVGGFIALGIASFNVGRSVESAFAGVAKTTNGLTDEFGKMNEAGKAVLDQFRDLSKEVPLALEELLKIGELAGQLGIVKESLVGFSEVVAALAVTTDLTVEKATLGLARIANIYAITADDMVINTERVGSALVFLGNNFATTEGEILDFAKRIAGIAKISGITQAEILGIGAAFTSVGIEAQAGGTAVQTVMIEMSKAVAESGDTLETFAKVSGKSADEFAEDWESDAAGAFTDFVSGLGDAGDDAFLILEDLGIADRRIIRAFLAVAGAGDLMKNSIEGANSAFEDNTALTREATIRYSTFDSQMQIVKNVIRDIGLEIGLFLLPAMADFLAIMTPIIEAIGDGLVPAFESIFDALTQDLLPAFGRLLDAFGFDINNADLTQGIANFGETIAGGIEAFADFVDEVADLIDLYKEGGIDSVAEHFGIDGDAVTLFLDIGAAVLIAAAAFVALKVALIGLGVVSGILGSLTIAFGNLGAAIALITGGEGVLATLGALFLGLPFILLGAIAVLIGVIAIFGERALENFLLLKDQLKEIFIKIWELAVENFENLKEQVGEIIAKLTENLKEKWEQILEDFGVTEEIKEKWRQIWEDVKLIAGTLLERAKEIIVEKWNAMVDSVTEFLAPIIERVSEIWEEIKEGIKVGWDKMIVALGEKGAEIGVKIGEFVVEWIAKIKDSANDWAVAGKAIMDGLLEGLKRNVGQILAFITNLARQVIDAILDAFGVESPSKVFRDIGGQLMKGLALGIAEGANLPQIALDAAGASMVSAESQAMSGSAISGNIDNSTSFNVNANYTQTQSPNTIADDLALAAMLSEAR